MRQLTSALSILLLCATPLAAQQAPPEPLQRPLEYRILLRTGEFSGPSTGYEGGPTLAVTSLRLLLARPQPEARTLLLDLVKQASAAGQLYALCGLYTIDRDAFQEAIEPFRSDEREVSYCLSGCIVTSARVREVAWSRSRWAVRLPRDHSSESIEDWEEAQNWPAHVQPRLDVVGGGLPLLLTQHSGYLSPRAPSGTVRSWVGRLHSKVDPKEIGEALAKFGRPGYDAARLLAKRKDPRARQVAAVTIWSLGVSSLGPHANEAAAVVSPLLLDTDPTVVAWATHALYELAPWISSAQGHILQALDAVTRLPKAPSSEDLTQLLRLSPWGGERAIPILARLLESDEDGLRCKVGCRLVRHGTAARSALAKWIGDPSFDCARSSLAELGVAPGSAEFRQVLALLSGQDEELVGWAAEVLAELGPQAGPSARVMIEAAERRFARSPSVLGLISRARWKTTGRTAGLIPNLVAGEDYHYLPEAIESQPELAGELAPFLRNPTRWRLLETIAELGPRAAPLRGELALLALRTEPESRHAARLGRAIYSVTGEPEFLLRVIGVLLPKEPRRALGLLRLLGASGLPLLPRVEAALRSKDMVVRRFAMSSLRAMGRSAERRSVPALVSQLRVEKVAVSSLVNLIRLAEEGSSDARSAVERAAGSEEDSYVRFLAQEALDEWRPSRDR